MTWLAFLFPSFTIPDVVVFVAVWCPTHHFIPALNNIGPDRQPITYTYFHRVANFFLLLTLDTIHNLSVMAGLVLVQFDAIDKIHVNGEWFDLMGRFLCASVFHVKNLKWPTDVPIQSATFCFAKFLCSFAFCVSEMNILHDTVWLAVGLRLLLLFLNFILVMVWYAIAVHSSHFIISGSSAGAGWKLRLRPVEIVGVPQEVTKPWNIVWNARRSQWWWCREKWNGWNEII